MTTPHHDPTQPTADKTSWDPTRPTADETTRAAGFFETAFGPESTPPFAFDFDGDPWAGSLAGWQLERLAPTHTERGEERTLLWRHGSSGLSVRCVAVAYDDFPTVEWTVYMRND